MERTPRPCCPRCRGALDETPPRWRCDACGASYPTLRGIPDLRVADDVFLSNADDWAFARRLEADFDRLDFGGLLERYFDLSPEIPPDLRRRQIAHIRSAPERAGQWLDALGERPAGPVLDLGCGTGSFLAAVGGRLDGAWGLDIAMRWLLLARKRLDEEGLGHARLVCGCAESLPAPDGSFAAVVAGDVIEHVNDQLAALAEAHRVLRGGGAVFLASPNRYSLAPEPHVQVWGVGYLPRRWMAPYVRLVRRADFRAIRTLGLGEWRRLLGRSPFSGGQIHAPGLPEADLAGFGPVKRRVGRLYNRMVAAAPGQWLARRIGPLFHVVCRRGQSASRATRQGSSRPRASAR